MDRMLQINQLLQAALAQVLQQEIEWTEPVFPTVVKIDTSPDLTNAKVFISAIPTDKTKYAVGVLVKNRKKIRQALSKATRQIRKIPELTFYPDFTEAEAYKIEGLMDN